MSSQTRQPGFFDRMIKLPREGILALGSQLRRGRIALYNLRRRRSKIGYIVYPLSGPFPERNAPPRRFYERWLPLPIPTPPSSMQQFNSHIMLMSEAANVNGVLFVIENLSAAVAKLQSLRQGFETLKKAGKEVVVYIKSPSIGKYFLASAADKILMPPSASLQLVGLYREIVFLAEALEEVGIQFENFQISPYKSALDNLSRKEISKESEEMMNWLLDEQYEILLQGIAVGRGMSMAEIQKLVDEGPYTAGEALQANLIDELAYEDELEKVLFPNAQSVENGPERSERSKKLVPWPEAAKRMTRIYRKVYRRKAIGVVSLTGNIMMGESQSSPIPLPLPIPFVGQTTAGEKTLVRTLRQAEKMKNLGALIFHVDSPGGDALASDLIGREIERISQKLPVVVYFGDVAASGGYYVAAKAQHIMCQPATITGSIGVTGGKVGLDGLYQKLHLHKHEFQRGNHANIYASSSDMTDHERQIIMEGIVETYKNFKWVVSKGRDIPFHKLDPICLGRVWSGRQAKGHNLVDSHGGFKDALWEARKLAKLPLDESIGVPVINIQSESRQWILPPAFSQATDPAKALITFLNEKRIALQKPQYLMPFEFIDHL